MGAANIRAPTPGGRSPPRTASAGAATASGSNATGAGRLPELVRDKETGEILELTRSQWSSKEGRLNLDYDTIVKMGTGRLDIAQRLKDQQEREDERLRQIAEKVANAMSAAKEGRSKSKRKGRRNSASFTSSFGSTQSEDVTATPVGSPKPSMSISFSTSSLPPIMDASTAEAATSGHNNASVQRHPLVTQFLKEGPIRRMHHRFWNARLDDVVIPEGQEEDVPEEGVDYYDRDFWKNLRDRRRRNRSGSGSSGSSSGSGSSSDSSVSDSDSELDGYDSETGSEAETTKQDNTDAASELTDDNQHEKHGHHHHHHHEGHEQQEHHDVSAGHMIHIHENIGRRKKMLSRSKLILRPPFGALSSGSFVPLV
jgi:hypothetical protein